PRDRQELAKLCPANLSQVDKDKAETASRQRETKRILDELRLTNEAGVIEHLCTNLMMQAPEQVPWERCVIAACKSGNENKFINSAPAIRWNDLRQLCPEKAQ